MRPFLVIFLVLVGVFARAGSPSSTSENLEFTISHFAVTPPRLVRSGEPGEPDDPDELRRTRFMITFRARLRNVGTMDIVVPTYLGREQAQPGDASA